MKSNIQQGVIVLFSTGGLLLIIDLVFDQAIQEETLFFMLSIGLSFIISSTGLYIYEMYSSLEKNTWLNTLVKSLIVSLPLIIFIPLFTDQSLKNLLTIAVIYVLSSLIFN